MQAAKLVGFLVGALAGSTAAAQEVGDARKGLVFAQRVCAECHGVAPGQIVPATAPTFRAIANTPGMTALALNVFLRTPHRSMPNLVISDGDRDNVIAYILSLRDKR
ncbi:MAG TPA: c-type cytochrome [Hyphomicrobiaceae bacterium]|jgi:mono/diheme cytochrome c family protein|nr:c-type cytochrome [Hyphomicrobiaceae bacterium]